MNAHKTMMIMSVVFVICIAIAILGTLTLYGTITRIDAQPVLVDDMDTRMPTWRAL